MVRTRGWSDLLLIEFSIRTLAPAVFNLQKLRYHKSFLRNKQACRPASPCSGNVCACRNGNTINMFTSAEWRWWILWLTTDNGSSSLTSLLVTKPKRNHDQMRATVQSYLLCGAESSWLVTGTCELPDSAQLNAVLLTQGSVAADYLCLAYVVLQYGSADGATAVACETHCLKLSERQCEEKWDLRCHIQGWTKGRDSRTAARDLNL